MFEFAAAIKLRLLIVLTVITVILHTNAELTEWNIPNAQYVKKAEVFCQKLFPYYEVTELSDIRIRDDTIAKDPALQSYLKCMMSELGLWEEYLGFNAKKVAKLFAKHKLIEEVLLVVNYCNDRYENKENQEQWTMDAYRCATSGTIGDWANELMKGFYNKKKQ